MNLLPDYQGGSIVNLVASLQRSRGSTSSFKQVPWLQSKDLSKKKNVVLLVVDGLGCNTIEKYGKGSFLEDHQAGCLTSVFPSTTAACLTSFSTGQSPAQHAITGWFTFVKEFGMVMQPIIFKPVAKGGWLDMDGDEVSEWFGQKTIHERMKCASYTITRKHFLQRPYSQMTQKGAKTAGYQSLQQMSRLVRNAVRQRGKKFVYAYWDAFDTLSHDYGVDSPRTKKHFRQFDREVKSLCERLEGTDTSLIITADHGLFDMPRKHNLWARDYPDFEECLTLPLSGESRAASCFVRPDKVGRFKQVVKREFDGIFSLHKGSDLIKRGWFGPAPYSPRLRERVGDFILLAETDYCIRGSVWGVTPHVLVGMHGGIKEEEMRVPVVRVDV